jgi:hypothetical protein
MSREDLSRAMQEMDESGGGEVDFGEFYDWWRGSSSKKTIPIATRSMGSFDIMPIAKIRGVANWGKQRGVQLYRTTQDRIREIATADTKYGRNLDGESGRYGSLSQATHAPDGRMRLPPSPRTLVHPPSPDTVQPLQAPLANFALRVLPWQVVTEAPDVPPRQRHTYLRRRAKPHPPAPSRRSGCRPSRRIR